MRLGRFGYAWADCDVPSLCDGYGHQVIGGIGEELLRKSVEGGSPTAGPRGHVPPCWNGPAGEEERAQTRFRVDYDAAP